MSTSNAPAPAAATVAIDTGGTFTDLVAIGTDGSVRIAKSPSTPNAPLGALLDVLEKSASRRGCGSIFAAAPCGFRTRVRCTGARRIGPPLRAQNW